MSLTNVQLQDLAEKMGIDLQRVCFKNELHEKPLVYNAGYIINLEIEFGENNRRNPGSHWTSFYIQKLSNGTIYLVYFDPFGVSSPQDVLSFIKRTHTFVVSSSEFPATYDFILGIFINFMNGASILLGT